MIRLRMNRNNFKTLGRIILSASLASYAAVAPAAQAYAFAYTVADMRLPSAQSGGSACPQADHWNSSLAGGINNRWSTSLSTNPVTILTQDQTVAGRPNEIESVIAQSFGVWTGVSGTTLASRIARNPRAHSHRHRLLFRRRPEHNLLQSK